ncbi:ChaB family protein [Rickettsia canadensis]|uniref:Cation transport regulator ChaB n=1 Tax=Rickettsia canadensis str. CA410 TaxID=1105107 RepID=A0ABN4ACK3_RICCA|nr:ChaB family protein [Rickettsia canadensis]AFB20755.1 hypothetical protein RCA_00890 [Rickettsia canadensis str. CA410]
MLRIFYREAFNHAFERYNDADKRHKDDSREAVAHKVACSAVEKQYHKNDKGHWLEEISPRNL